MKKLRALLCDTVAVKAAHSYERRQITVKKLRKLLVDTVAVILTLWLIKLLIEHVLV